MTNLECDQLLPTVPEVYFEVAMTLACSLFFALYIYCFYPHARAIDRYHGFMATAVLKFQSRSQDTVRWGTKLQNLLTSICDLESGIHHVIIFTRPSPRYSYCK